MADLQADLVGALAVWKASDDHRAADAAKTNLPESVTRAVQEVTKGSLTTVSSLRLPGLVVAVAKAAEVDAFRFICEASKHHQTCLVAAAEAFPDRFGEAVRESGHQRLFLTEVDLSAVVDQLSAVNLRSLTLKDCKIKELPEDFFLKITGLERLDLSFNPLRVLPKSVCGLEDLRSATLVRTRAGWTLPAGFHRLKALEVLHIGVGFPEQVTQLPALKRLVVAGPIKSIPLSIGAMQTLEQLDMSSGRLNTVPDEIGQLTSLKHLYLHGNDLDSLPDLTRLTALERLSVDDEVLTGAQIEALRNALPNCSIEM